MAADISGEVSSLLDASGQHRASGEHGQDAAAATEVIHTNNSDDSRHVTAGPPRAQQQGQSQYSRRRWLQRVRARHATDTCAKGERTQSRWLAH